MSKKFNKIAIIVITILLSELLNAYAFSFLAVYKKHYNPYALVAITMALSVCIFYPAFSFINKYLKKVSGKYMSKTARFAGGNITGRAFGFLTALALIYLAMAQVLYQRNAVTDLIKWLSGN